MEKYKHNTNGNVIDESEYDSLSFEEQLDYSKVEESEFGNLSIMTDGHAGINLGNGLSYDISDGKIGINLGGGFSLPL